MVSAVHAVLGALIVVILIYLVYITIYVPSKGSKEHFVTDEYESRMQVMKIFDMILSRKPSAEEIDKYSKFGNEQDILVNVLKDYAADVDKKTAEIKAEVKAEEAPAPQQTESFEMITVKLSKEEMEKSLAVVTSELDKLKKMVAEGIVVA